MNRIRVFVIEESARWRKLIGEALADAPEKIRDLIRQSLEKRPAERVASMAEVIDLFDRAAIAKRQSP